MTIQKIIFPLIILMIAINIISCDSSKTHKEKAQSDTTNLQTDKINADKRHIFKIV